MVFLFSDIEHQECQGKFRIDILYLRDDGIIFSRRKNIRVGQIGEYGISENDIFYKSRESERVVFFDMIHDRIPVVRVGQGIVDYFRYIEIFQFVFLEKNPRFLRAE